MSNSSISDNSVYRKSFNSIDFKCQTVLFGPLIKPYQVLPLRVRVVLRAIAMKEYNIFPRAPLIRSSLSNSLISNPGHSLGRESYPSVEMQSVYSTAPIEGTENQRREIKTKRIKI